MAKQIKIGFDKVPAPVTKQFTQLVDIEGTKLFDAAGNPLVTEEEAASGAFTSGENALSIHINNGELETQGGNISIEEQFGETSDVSSSLLGVPRAEEQLSLFADVATYGLDEEQWSEYVYSDGRHPTAWYRKKNPIYGRRSQPNFYEGSTEQALYLMQYPSQYSYPRGPVERNTQSPSDEFILYMNFIALGKYLYDTFLNVDRLFAEKYFISDDIAYIVDEFDTQIPIVFDTSALGSASFVSSGSYFDVKYASTEQISYDQIEAWTYFFDLVKDNLATFPPLDGAISDFKQTAAYDKIIDFAKNQCRPGGSPYGDRYAILQSKRAFRYQPGRASGFTFGTRMKSDPTSLASVLEWGCSNDTDEYMFQLKGSQFNIIRRSTIRMPDELLLRQGLKVTDQSEGEVFIKAIDNSIGMHETVIPRSRFNGDSLLGNGPSGYILSFEDVTMYKIEFSWYGAIGAKFYAYVPIGNGEARWVLLHTFVIENGLGEPVLNNPDFKFKYLTSCSDSSTLKAPQFIYKYGSSYYVDGGDEGTVRLATTTVDKKSFKATKPTAVLGLLPKNTILNGDGVSVINSKKSYPIKINVNASQNCRIDIEEIKGSPDGMHFNFAPSIVQSGDHPDTRYLRFTFQSGAAATINSLEDYTALSSTIEFTVPAENVGEMKMFPRSGQDFSGYMGALRKGDGIIIAGFNYLVVSVGVNEIQLELDKDRNPTTSFAFPARLDPNFWTATVVKRLNKADKDAKIIADGVYGSYVKFDSFASEDNRSTTIQIVDPDDYYTLKERPTSKGVKSDGISFVDPIRKDSFSAKLSGLYTIVASKTPIYANRFKIHWLNPIKYDTTYSRKHFSDFGITVSPYPPVEPGTTEGEDRVSFLYDSANTFYKRFDVDEYPMVRFSHRSVQFSNLLRAGIQEWDPSYGFILDTDPRLNEDPIKWDGYPSNDNRSQAGRPQAIEFNVGVFDYAIDSVVDSGDYDDGYDPATHWKVIFAPNVSGPSDNAITLDDSAEIGTDFRGTGKFFASRVFKPSLSNNYFYALKGEGTTEQQLPADLTTGTIQLKTLTISDDWRLRTRDDDGSLKFDSKFFELFKIVPFGAQPFYPVFALSNNASINSIVIEEIKADGTIQTHCPELITENSESNPNISIENHGSDGHTQPPGAFNSLERLEALRYDMSSLQPLRPGVNISSFYVGANDPTEIDLSNVFAQDRRGVSRGLLNDKAIYFKAQSLDGVDGQIEMTLTTKEQ
jgi:hypothetical protein